MPFVLEEKCLRPGVLPFEAVFLFNLTPSSYSSLFELLQPSELLYPLPSGYSKPSEILQAPELRSRTEGRIEH